MWLGRDVLDFPPRRYISLFQTKIWLKAGWKLRTRPQAQVTQQKAFTCACWMWGTRMGAHEVPHWLVLNLTVQCCALRLQNKWCGYRSEQVMWLNEWASGVLTCTKVCKEVQSMLLPQAREHGSVLPLPLPLGRYFLGSWVVWGSGALSLVRSAPSASGATGWRMNAGIRKGAGSMEKTHKAEIYIDN